MKALIWALAAASAGSTKIEVRSSEFEWVKFQAGNWYIPWRVG